MVRDIDDSSILLGDNYAENFEIKLFNYYTSRDVFFVKEIFQRKF